MYIKLYYKYTIGIIIILICITFLVINQFNDIEINNIKFNSNSNEKIEIYISGEVKSPGIIELAKSDSLKDAISKAGGITENADIKNIDIDRKLKNKEKIHIPSKEDETNVDDETNNESTSNSKVNINTAEKETLMTLKGIGKTMADKIIKYREDNGEFSDIEDIKNVNGIGENKYNEIKDNITIK